jgi:CBS domain-containing protein
LVRAFESDATGQLSLVDAGCALPYVAFPDETLNDALSRMLRQECGRLPVVSRENPKKIVGYLGRAAVLEARLRRIQEDNVRQPGWLKKTKGSGVP